MQPQNVQRLRQVLLFALVLAGACLFRPAAAADQMAPAPASASAPAAATGAAVSVPQATASIAPLFIKPMTLRGTLDGVQIQMRLQLKPGETAALEGNYVVAGQNSKILLAGEFEEDALMMEESVNGKDVSGLWDGVYDGVALRGNWSSLDGSVLRPFVLKVVPDQR